MSCSRARSATRAESRKVVAWDVSATSRPAGSADKLLNSTGRTTAEGSVHPREDNWEMEWDIAYSWRVKGLWYSGRDENLCHSSWQSKIGKKKKKKTFRAVLGTRNDEWERQTSVVRQVYWRVMQRHEKMWAKLMTTMQLDQGKEKKLDELLMSCAHQSMLLLRHWAQNKMHSSQAHGGVGENQYQD